MTTSTPTRPASRVPAAPDVFARKRERYSALVEAALLKALPFEKRAPASIVEAVRYSLTSGGKRFRPLLCLGAAEAAGKPARAVLPVACAVEFIHTYSLVHDDLPAMDNADERRGKPSVHRQFDEATAILAGDALLTLAFEALGTAKLPLLSVVIRELAVYSGTVGLIGGQALDLAAMRGGHGIDADDWIEIASRKTAALITASVVCGGMAAGASGAQIQHLRRFGQKIGLAFQLIDDAHDSDGLASVWTREQTRRHAEQRLQEAEKALTAFGSRAAYLRGMTQWLRETQ